MHHVSWCRVGWAQGARKPVEALAPLAWVRVDSKECTLGEIFAPCFEAGQLRLVEPTTAVGRRPKAVAAVFVYGLLLVTRK